MQIAQSLADKDPVIETDEAAEYVSELISSQLLVPEIALPVTGPEAIEWSRKLARHEGIFTGISGGGTFAIAMQKAEQAEEGSVILCMLPDTGERYLSTPLFEGIPTEMTEEETALSLSTPGYHMESAE